MFFSELQLSSATAKLFHLEQFAIYGILIVTCYNTAALPINACNFYSVMFHLQTIIGPLEGNHDYVSTQVYYKK